MKKVIAGALQLVTYIGVIIALFLATFLLLIHTHKLFRIKTNHSIEVITIANNGIHSLLEDKTVLNDTISLALNSESYKSCRLFKSYWGVFEKDYAKASIKHTHIEKVALLGAEQPGHPTALYLKDNNKPLVLVGDARIDGKAYLPKRGIKSGNIDGHGYYGDQFIYGETGLIKKFPSLAKDHVRYLEALIHENGDGISTENFINLNTSKIHNNSFKAPIKIAYSIEEIYLSDIRLSGHVIVKSKSRITVDHTAVLTDVILVAPRIEIMSNVKGKFQAIATETLYVSEAVTLEYPSALVLLRNFNELHADASHRIFIGDRSIITGNVLMLGQTAETNYNPQILINPSTVVKGMVYCEQNLELRGTVYGTVFTNNFVIQEAGSNYQNHLFNAKINASGIEDQFVGLPIQQFKSGIVQWLY